jgi:hypothetical protein
MNYFLAIIFILISWFLISKLLKKKRLHKFRKELLENWGKEKKKKYYNFFVISKYFNNNSHEKKAYHLISEKTKIDLDIDEVFKFIDRTSSKIGEQYLYFKLRTIGTVDKLLEFNSLTSIFQRNKELSISYQLELSKLNTNNSYYLEELINGKQLEKPKYIQLILALTLTGITSIVFSFFNPIFGLALIPILAINLVFHYKNKHSVTYYLNGVTQLSKALKVSEKLTKNREITSYFRDISFIKRIQSIKFKTEFIAFEKNVNNEFLFAFWFVAEIIKILFNIEYLMFYSFMKSIKKEQKKYRRYVSFYW